jgi:hypothetical protein
MSFRGAADVHRRPLWCPASYLWGFAIRTHVLGPRRVLARPATICYASMAVATCLSSAPGGPLAIIRGGRECRVANVVH